MSRWRPARSLAWSVWALAGLAMTASVALAPSTASEDAMLHVFALAAAAVGALVVSRVPSNLIGWVLVGFGLWVGAAELARTVMAARGDVEVAEWLAHWTWAPPLTLLLVVVPLLFPDGRPPSPRWWPLVLAAVTGAAGLTLNMAFGPYLGGVAEFGPNPYYVPASEPVTVVLGALLVPAFVGAVASVVVRFRRTRGPERQQIKWFVFATVVAAFVVVAVNFVPLAEQLTYTVIWLAVFLIPVSIGVAILRHRLYDIDRLISRTAGYGLVVGVLGLTFVAVAVGLPRLLGVPGENPLLVATATLAAAGLFNPLRRWVQGLVERRFNRARYDARREVDSLAERLRGAFELVDLRRETLRVVSRTMQPKAAVLWIREEGR